MARQNLGDRPVGAPLIYLQDDSVPDRQLPVFFTLLLEPASERCLVRLPRVGADVPYSARPLEHDAFLARQLLPSWRIESHQGSSSARLDLMSVSSVIFTSLSNIAPTILRASSSVVAKARNSVSRCPLATGSPRPQRTNRR